MPYNGSGTFNPAITYVPNTPARAEDQNTQDGDIATGLSNCMTRDGQAPALANLSMGGFQLNEVGNGSSTTDAINLGQLQSYFPSGQLIPYAGTTSPIGFLLCYGQAISRSTYSALFSAIGTLYGTGDGSTTFNIPDLRGRILAGADNMGGVAAGNLTGYVVGTTGGNQSITLTSAQIPAHTHGYSGNTGTESATHSHNYSIPNGTFTAGAGGSTFLTNSFGTQTTGPENTAHTHAFSGTTDNGTGGGLSHANVQPTIAINYLIRY